MSTLACQRAFSAGSLILATLAFICSREAFIFSKSTFMPSMCCLCISVIFWWRSPGVACEPLVEDGGACVDAACPHAKEARVNIRTSKRLLNLMGFLLSDNLLQEYRPK